MFKEGSFYLNKDTEEVFYIEKNIVGAHDIFYTAFSTNFSPEILLVRTYVLHSFDLVEISLDEYNILDAKYYNLEKLPLDEQAKVRAINWHNSVNQYYNDWLYSKHLFDVVSVGKKFIYYVGEDDKEKVIAGLWLHDAIEDARVTYSDVQKLFGIKVAEIVYALTNNKGRNRKERANKEYYKGIRETEYGSFCKICDRIANMKAGIESNGSMIDKYKKELEDFKKEVDPFNYYVDMWKYLNEILKIGI